MPAGGLHQHAKGDAHNPRAIAINNTTQIAPRGQAASEPDGHRPISDTGGQLQFVRGTYASEEGKSFICLASTYEKGSVRRSRIVLNRLISKFFI